MDKFPQLRLCDGTAYRFSGCDDVSGMIVTRFAEAMRLESQEFLPGERVIYVFSGHPWLKYPRKSDRLPEVSVVDPGGNGILLALQFMRISSVVALDAENRGGVLLHGALAERDGHGVLLAGPGGVGKTTAGRRLTHPWRTLCDDTTLVTRDSGGRYWAHPWPTWSRWMFGNSGGSWDVQRAVPLRAIFFLAQDETDRAVPIGAGKATTRLMEAASQVNTVMPEILDKPAYRALNLKRFDNICALAGSVPCYELHLSLTGAFWREMERVLEERSGRGDQAAVSLTTGG